MIDTTAELLSGGMIRFAGACLFANRIKHDNILSVVFFSHQLHTLSRTNLLPSCKINDNVAGNLGNLGLHPDLFAYYWKYAFIFHTR